MVGSLATPQGEVPLVTGHLGGRDRWGALLVRLGIGRMSYTVEPGLYAINHPGPDAPVLVTANYKLSFDHLRRHLQDLAAWILVLDTHGINVWCAAGKGLFSTAELVGRIKAVDLAQIITHRRLLLPQLSAPGIAAHAVRKQSGFKVVYGPVYARDLPAFLANHQQATLAMRLKTFTLAERAVLVPVELTIALKWAIPLSLVLLALRALTGAAGFWPTLIGQGFWPVAGLWAGVIAGSVATPLLLPWLPGRAFAVKGLLAGLVAAALLALTPLPRLDHWAWFFLTPALASFLALEFTGASTFTSLSGVKKEMRIALPCQIGAGLIGAGLWLAGRFM